MLLLRIYIASLTLIFFASALATNNFGVLQGIVTTSALLFLILDVRSDQNDLRRLETQLTNGD